MGTTIFGISKTTINGILAAVIATAGPVTAYLAAIQGNHAATVAAGLVTLAATIARVWVGLLQGDAPSNPPAPPAAKAGLILLCLLIPLIGVSACKGPTASAPLAPWAVNQADEQAGSIIAACDAVVTRYEADVKAGFQPSSQFRAVIVDLQTTLAVAQPAYDIWHTTLKTNPQAGEPAAVTAAIVTLAADLAKLPALAGN